MATSIAGWCNSQGDAAFQVRLDIYVLSPGWTSFPIQEAKEIGLPFL